MRKPKCEACTLSKHSPSSPTRRSHILCRKANSTQLQPRRPTIGPHIAHAILYQRQGPFDPVPCYTHVQYPLERSLHFHASPRICDARIGSARSRFQDIYPICSPHSLHRQSISRYTSHLGTPIYQTFTATRFLVDSTMRLTPGCDGTVLKRGARDRKLCRGFHFRPDITQRP
jgi:hypothetical protein